MGYLFSLNSTEHLTKAVKRLPNFLRHSFYKYCNPIKHSNKNIYTLKELEKWRENKMQQFFNPVANILATSDENKRGDKPLFARNNHSSTSNISKMICWYCLKDHKLTVYERFISLNLSKKNNFVGIVCRRDTKLRTVRQPQNVQIVAIKNITRYYLTHLLNLLISVIL